MNISLNWLNDFIDLEEIKIKNNIKEKAQLAAFIADKLTNVGFEVEEVIDVAKHLNHVVVGKIEKISKHPEADRLFVCDVNIGDKHVQIITSATNISEGDFVPVSLDGAHLANGIDIKPSKMRGVLSEGMFCSGEELGIDDNFYDGASVNGILIFKDNFAAGTPVAEALKLDDYVLDVAIMANRPDCMSVIGIAREVSAIFGLPVKEQDLSYSTNDENISKYIDVEVKDFALCPRYIATAVKNIKIEKSPLEMRARLFAVGIHPINNIVDITNYVLTEYGQPMHAFDKDYLSGGKIVVRRAENGEKIEVLNGNTYELKNENLVIADEKKPCVIAGIIGGTNSCINNETTTCIFESAVFERSQIRKTARQIGVRTDSSARFEKGVDLGSALYGMKKALHLVSKLNCGEIISGMIDKKTVEVCDQTVQILKSDIDKILGINVEEKDISSILSSLGIKVVFNGNNITLTVPSFRSDIENANDVAEEIIRMYGYDIYNSVNSPLFKGLAVTQGKYDDVLFAERKFKNFLITRGFNEVLSYSLVSENAVKNLLIKDGMESNPIKLANPLSEELGTLRTTMAHSIFSNIEYNTKRNNKDFAILECGRIYLTDEKELTKLPKEKNVFAFASVRPCDDFFTFKGYIEVILKDYDVNFTLDYSKKPYLHTGVSADVILEDGRVLASFGKINPKVAENYEISDGTFYAEIFVDELVKLSNKSFVVKKISKYPVVERDLALVADEKITASEIETIIRQSMGKNFYSVKLFDIYRGKNLEGKKSLAYNLKFSNDEKTLTDEEINNSINKILRRLNDTLGVVLR